MMVSADEVTTTRLTLCFYAALSTANVPSTAGLIRTSSSLGATIGIGEAVWTT